MSASLGTAWPVLHSEDSGWNGVATFAVHAPALSDLRLAAGVLAFAGEGGGAAYLFGAATLALPDVQLTLYAGPPLPGSTAAGRFEDRVIALAGTWRFHERFALVGEAWLGGEREDLQLAEAVALRLVLPGLSVDAGVAHVPGASGVVPWLGLGWAIPLPPWRWRRPATRSGITSRGSPGTRADLGASTRSTGTAPRSARRSAEHADTPASNGGIVAYLDRAGPAAVVRVRSLVQGAILAIALNRSTSADASEPRVFDDIFVSYVAWLEDGDVLVRRWNDGTSEHPLGTWTAPVVLDLFPARRARFLRLEGEDGPGSRVYAGWVEESPEGDRIRVAGNLGGVWTTFPEAVNAGVPGAVRELSLRVPDDGPLAVSWTDDAGRAYVRVLNE